MVKVYYNHLFAVLLLTLISTNSLWGQSFYFGNDLSYVNQMEDCGAIYKENGIAKDVYQIFADHGTNLVRVRLWIDPSWWQSPLTQPAGVKSYYNDIVDVTETIQRAKQAGMQVMLGFHFSDFWPEVNRQLIPRKWLDVATNNTALVDSVYNYMFNVLSDLDDQGLMPEIVKVGNESNNGILLHRPSGDTYNVGSTASTDWTRHASLYNSAIKAIRDAGASSSINPKIAVHLTNGLSRLPGFFRALINSGVTDFDILGFSYYYSWHGGSISELESTVRAIKTEFASYEVMVVETGYLWSTSNYDALGNIITTPDPEYLPVIPEKQLEYMVDYARAVKNGGGSGVVFWEPAWVSTPCSTPFGVGSSHDHVAFFEPGTNNFMKNGGGRWMEPRYYEDFTAKKVVFKVDMKDCDVSNGVYFMASFLDEPRMPIKMASEGNGIYSYFTYLPQGSNGGFYFMNGSSPNNKESIPNECRLWGDSARIYSMGSQNNEYVNKWSSCVGLDETLPIVTFTVDMTGQDISRGVYIVGEVNSWEITAMEDIGNNIYSWSSEFVSSNEVLSYYYLTTNTWTNYLNYRESVPSECVEVYGSDRGVAVPEYDLLISDVWSSCDPQTGVNVHSSEEAPYSYQVLQSDRIINIKCHSECNSTSVSIYNLSGQQLFYSKTNTEKSNWKGSHQFVTPGVYLLVITDGNVMYQEKIAVI